MGRRSFAGSDDFHVKRQEIHEAGVKRALVFFKRKLRKGDCRGAFNWMLNYVEHHESRRAHGASRSDINHPRPFPEKKRYAFLSDLQAQFDRRCAVRVKSKKR